MLYVLFDLPFRCGGRLLTAYLFILVMLRSAHTPSLTPFPISFNVEYVAKAQRKYFNIKERSSTSKKGLQH